jgi:hypothetical protein
MADSAGNDDVNLVRPAEDRGRSLGMPMRRSMMPENRFLHLAASLNPVPKWSWQFDLHIPSLFPACTVAVMVKETIAWKEYRSGQTGKTVSIMSTILAL